MNLDRLFPEGLYVAHALDQLGPVAVYVLGLSAYAIFIFRFYRFVAARDMFAVDWSRYEESRYRWVRRALGVVMYVAKYLILFPAFAAFWFAVLTLILTFLSRDRLFTDILLIALATVSAIRVTAYYDEDLSRDLAKILPFAVLAIFLIDASFFEIAQSLSVLERANENRETILYYLVFLVGLEFSMRLVRAVLRVVFRRRRRRAPVAEPVYVHAEPAPGPAQDEEPPSAAEDAPPSAAEDDGADAADESDPSASAGTR